VPAGQAAAAPVLTPPALAPPVDAPIDRRFEAPSSPYGPGHRGIDYRVAAETDVRAAQAGIVRFAGTVAGVAAVTIFHGSALETTYTDLAAVSVDEGDSIAQGQWIGRSGSPHAGRPPGLHFGVRLRGRYVDPEDLLVAADVSRALHLAPLAGDGDRDTIGGRGEGDGRHCAEVSEPGRSPPPPNDNVVVGVAGIGSETHRGAGPELYDGYLTRSLGYPRPRVYTFSYRGTEGPRLHRDHRREDTYDLRAASQQLAGMLTAVAVHHPSAEVDLVTHGGGGLVARDYLRSYAESVPKQPRVEHLVTLAAPHRGTTLAEAVDDLNRNTLTGEGLLDTLSVLSERGWIPLPDPRSEAVADLRGDSDLVASLAEEDLVYGTRALSIAAPLDLIVPAHMSSLRNERTHVVPPSGLWAHTSVLHGGESPALAYSFLRDAPDACKGLSDRLGPVAGRVVAEGHGRLAEALSRLEDRGLGRVARVAAGLGRRLLSRLRTGLRGTLDRLRRLWS
ncbi:MAG: peptidoglycan DD-metalloendopeptidase family protein, partial [Actinomycetota bacterium]